MIQIKPHHFMDILKLYGGGITVFVPAPDYGHDFYRAANECLHDRDILLCLTCGADDICKPCRYLTAQGHCGDEISHIPGINSKDAYNELLDRRILLALGLPEGCCLPASALAEHVRSAPGLVRSVWREEAPEAVEKRERLVAAGAEKFLQHPVPAAPADTADITVGEMLSMQRTLQERYRGKWEPISPPVGQSHLLWLLGEVGEVIDIIKKDGCGQIMEDEAVRARFVEELADVLMYYHDVLLCYDISPKELKQAYTAKFRRNMERW